MLVVSHVHDLPRCYVFQHQDGLFDAFTFSAEFVDGFREVHWDKPIVDTLDRMTRRETWRKIVDAQVQRWSAMSCEELAGALHDVQCYEVEFDSKPYQVEVELMENTEEYLHVYVAVDDGSLPASMLPESRTFICRKPPSGR